MFGWDKCERALGDRFDKWKMKPKKRWWKLKKWNKTKAQFQADEKQSQRRTKGGYHQKLTKNDYAKNWKTLKKCNNLHSLTKTLQWPLRFKKAQKQKERILH